MLQSICYGGARRTPATESLHSSGATTQLRHTTLVAEVALLPGRAAGHEPLLEGKVPKSWTDAVHSPGLSACPERVRAVWRGGLGAEVMVPVLVLVTDL